MSNQNNQSTWSSVIPVPQATLQGVQVAMKGEFSALRIQSEED